MLKYFTLVFALIIAVLGLLYFRVGVSQVIPSGYYRPPQAHRLNDNKQPISNIHVTVMYFVPKNRQDVAISNWKEILTTNAEKLQAFHAAQFQENSRITYTVYPQKIIGLHDSLYYDTENTQNGNPRALRSVALEIEERSRQIHGDIELPNQTDEDGTYYAWVVVYEGVGASGSEHVAFISRIFLSEAEYSTYGSTFFTHEFYHTIGLPDAYDTKTSVPFSNDIMGLGRFRPLEHTYIEQDVMVRLGIL